MAGQPSDEDIINDAYAERLRAVFDNFVDVAPSDPAGAKAKFIAGVGFLRQARVTALQALSEASDPLAASAASAKAPADGKKTRKS